MSRPMPRRRVPWRTIAWLTLVWVLLWGDFSPATTLVGLIVGFGLTAVFPLPSIRFKGQFHASSALFLVWRFAIDLVVASVQVALLALSPSRHPRGAVIRVELLSHSDLYLTFTAQLTTLVPGSLVVEANRQAGVLYLHLLDVDTLGGIEKVRADTLEVEARILRSFASDQELEAAGLARHPRSKRGRRST